MSQKELERERILAPSIKSTRARLDASSASYSVAPKSTYDATRVDPMSRPIGAGGDLAFRRMTAKLGRKRG
jgi:transcription factor SPN1